MTRAATDGVRLAVSAVQCGTRTVRKMMRRSNSPSILWQPVQLLFGRARLRIVVGVLLGGLGGLWSAWGQAQTGMEVGCAARAPVYPRWMQVLAPVQRVPSMTDEEQEEFLTIQQVLALQWGGSAMERAECQEPHTGAGPAWPLPLEAED